MKGFSLLLDFWLSRIPTNFSKAFLGIIIFILSMTLSFSAGSILVKITDEKDQPLPGATVTLSNEKQLIADMPIVTDIEGKAFFPVLPIGTGYKITVQFPGYAKIVQSDIRVRGIKGPLVYLIKLIPEEDLLVKEVVTHKRDIVSLDETQSSMTMSDLFLEAIPIAGRDYQSILSRAPAVLDSNRDGNPNVKGSRDRDFKALIDGISNVDPLTGKYMSNLNLDAIEEIEIITGGAGAEYSRAQGGFAKIITKQGSNEFSGTFNFYYRSRYLDGNGATDLPEEDFSDYKWENPSVLLSGALIKDKLFWIIAHEYFDVGFPINALTRGLVIENKRWRHFDKLTWQVTGRNKLIFQFSADPNETSNLGLYTTVYPESGFQYKSGGPTYSISWVAPVSPKLLVSSLVAYSDTTVEIVPMTHNVENRCTKWYDDEIFRKAYCFDLNTNQVSGSFFQTWKDERQRLTAKSDMEYYIDNFLGAPHHIKAGFVMEDERYFLHYDRGPVIARYVTEKVEEVSPGREKVVKVGYANALFSYPNPFKGKATGSSFGIYFEDSIKPLRNLTLNIGLRIDQELINSPGLVPIDPHAEMLAFEQKLVDICTDFQNCIDYLVASDNAHWEDDLLIIDNDLEAKKWVVENDLLYRAMGEFSSYEDEYGLAEAFTEHGGFREALTARWRNFRKWKDYQLSNLNVAPRFGFSWDPWNKGKAKIFGSYGRYYDKLFFSIPLEEQFPISYNLTFGVDSEWEFIDTYNTLADPGVSFRMVDKDLETPYMDEIALGFETEIAMETSLRLSVTKREYKNQLQDIDINLYTGDYGPNGSIYCDPRNGIVSFEYLGQADGQLDDCAGLTRYSVEAWYWFERTIAKYFPDGRPDLFIANPMFNEILKIGNINSSTYKDFEIEVIKRRHHHWELQASYVYSVAQGQVEDYDQGLGDEPTTVDDEEGYLAYDQRHVLKVNTTMEIPLWDLKAGLLVTWESGLPYSFINRTAAFNANNPFIGKELQPQSRFRTLYPTGQRNDQRNESFWTFDVHIQKDLLIKKTMVSLFADIFNLLNEDRLRIYRIENNQLIAERRFGRQLQVGVKVKF
jgi:outer membrane receptor protein involved in Fe transport